MIPNAIITQQFKPELSQEEDGFITIVVISRLAYRKGVDLLVATAPRVCKAFPDVRFLVGEQPNVGPFVSFSPDPVLIPRRGWTEDG